MVRWNRNRNSDVTGRADCEYGSFLTAFKCRSNLGELVSVLLDLEIKCGSSVKQKPKKHGFSFEC